MGRPIGVQSFTYRAFDNQAIIDELQGTAIDAIELCGVHIDPEVDPQKAQQLRERYEDAGIDICGYGVHGFDSPDTVDSVVSFAADLLGADYLSVHAPPAEPAVIDALVDAAADHDLLVAVHNHGPGHAHDTVADVQALLADRPSHFGACVDTGHFFRSGEALETQLSTLGERVHAVHCKDFVDEDTEVPPGDGQLDLNVLLTLLDEKTAFAQPIVIEYELDEENPTPVVEQTVERIRAAERTTTPD
jgi:sugar phosphate isomerase/epimerase